MKRGSTWFSTILIFVMCLALLAALTGKYSLASMTDVLNNGIDISGFINSFVNDPTNWIAGGVVFGFAVVTGNSAMAALVPLFALFTGMFTVIDDLLGKTILGDLATANDPYGGILVLFLKVLFKSLVSLATIMFIRGIIVI